MANDTNIGGASLEFTVDGSQAIVTLDQIEDKAGRVDDAAGRAAAALGGIGDQAGAGAQKVDRATQQLISSVQRATAVIDAGQRGTASYFETLANQRGLNVDALRPFIEQLRQAQDAQSKLAASAAQQAESQRAATAAVAENRRAFEQQAQAREAYLEKLREEIKLLGMSEAAQRAYKAAKANEAAGGGSEGAALYQILERQRTAQLAAAQAAREEAEAQREAAAAKRANDSFITNLERQAASIGKTRADLLEMEAAQRGLTTQAAPFISRLRESERAVHGVGMSAGQTAAALRTLPAQFTDIATQLAGGQSPLLILLQQGGQIKDSFGGIGNAARALAGLLTPLRVALGGVGAVAALVGAAYAQGSKEQDNFARGLILTGNVSGKTVGQLNEQAKAISTIVGTQGKAAEALTQVVNAGNIASEAYGKVAEAAIRLERVGGPAIEETVNQFAALGKDPLQAAGKLNEKVNFLTVSLYQQIKALQEQGRTSEAARVAQEGYANALINRTQQIEARSGIFERSWKTLGDAAKIAWDKMLNIGRPETVEEAVAKAAAAVEAATARLQGTSRRGGTANELRGGGSVQEVQAAQELLDTQREGLKIERQIAEAKAASAFQTQSRIDTEQMVEASLSAQVKLAKDLAAARTKLEAAGRPQAEIDAALRTITTSSAAFQQSIALVGARAEAAVAIVGAKSRAELQQLQSLREQGLIRERDYIERVAAADLRMLQAERERLVIQKQSAASKPGNQAEVESVKGQIEAKDIEILTRRKQLLDDVTAAAIRQANAIRDAMQALREEGESEINAQLQQQQEARNAIVRSIQEYKVSIDESNEAMALELQTIGMESQKRAVLIEQFRIELDLRRRLRQIEATPYDSQEDRQRDIDAARALADRAKAAAGAKVWLDEYQKVNDQIGQSLTDALMNGGKSAGELLKNYFKTLVLRPIIQAVVNPISGAIASFMTGGAAGAAGGGGAGNSWLSLVGSAGQLGGGWGNIASTVGGYFGFGGGAAATGSAIAGSSYGAAVNAALAEYGITSGATATAGSGAAAAGSSAAAAIPIIGWIIAAIMASKAAYEGGNTLDMLDGKTDYGVGKFEADKYDTLTSLGVSDKWAQILSGAPLTARLFGSKASASGFGIGTIENGEFVQGTSAPFKFGANTLGTGANEFLQDLSSRLAGSVALSASLFGGGLTNGLRVGALTDRDRENEVSSLLGYFGADNKLIAGVQTGSGAFGVGGPGTAASKIAAGDLDKWISEQMPVLIIQGLQQSDLEDRFDAYFSSIAAAKLTPEVANSMLATATAAKQLSDAFGPLGGVFDQFETASIESIGKTAKAAGGFDALASSADAYVQAFLSDSQRTAAATERVGKVLAGVGLTMPDLSQSAEDVRKQWVAMVNAQDISTDSGRKALATLLSLAGTVDTLAQSAEQARNALKDAIGQTLPKFQTPQEQVATSYATISQDLRGAGLDISVQTLMNASKDEIRAFTEAFVGLSSNSVEAKTAVVNIAGALADLKDSAAETAASVADRTGNLQIQLLQAQGRETEALNLQRQIELGSLRALEQSLGVAAGTFTRLQTEIYAASDATAKMVKDAQLLSGLDSVVADFLSPKDLALYRASRVQTTLAQGGITASVESILGASREDILELWAAVGDEGKQAILDAYGLWEELQFDLTKTQRESLTEQIDGLKRIRDLASDIQQFTRSLKFSDLSPLSAQDQLNEAQSLFDITLAKARGGDADAAGQLQGIATDLLNEAQGAFASGPAYTAIFNAVTGALDEFGGFAAGLDPQIAAAEAQLASLDSIGAALGRDGDIYSVLSDIHATISGETIAGAAPTDRTFVAGPNGSSGGLSGEVDLSPVRRSDAGAARQSDILPKILAKLDEVIAINKEVAAASNATAVIGQQASKKNEEAIAGLQTQFNGLVREARQSNARALAPVRA